MKTNLGRLELTNGKFTFGKFLGSIDTEYFTGTDMYPDIVDFYLGIDGLYYVWDHKGIRETSLSERFLSRLENQDLKWKKRGHRCNSNNKQRERERKLRKEMEFFDTVDVEFDELPF